MALLGIALQEHFPAYYHYFSTRYYRYHGRRMRNHNHLLGRIKGVDGIKTGFTNASGFNLVASVARGKRRIIAVVMGGRSSRSRDAQVARLISKYLPKASRHHKGPLLAARTSAGIVLPGHVSLPPADEAPIPERRAGDVLAYAPEDVAVPTADPKMPVPADVDPVTTAASRPDGWTIQIGSLPSEAGARAVLARASAKAGTVLASASPFTETFKKGSTVYHRARFAGFASKRAAWNACSALKKKDFGCFAISP
jgi:D-alanyl-D-alanine carboxypeptidase